MTKKRQALWLFVIFGLLVLDWLALDDITTNQEGNYYLEWSLLILSFVFFFSSLIYFVYKKNKAK